MINSCLTVNTQKPDLQNQLNEWAIASLQVVKARSEDCSTRRTQSNNPYRMCIVQDWIEPTAASLGSKHD